MRPQAETERDNIKRVELLKQASEFILKAKQLDHASLEYLSSILQTMMASYFDVNVVQYVYQILSSVDKNILKTKGIRELRNRTSKVINKIPFFEGREDFIAMLIDYDEIVQTLKEDEAVVYHLKDNFGFIKNKNYWQGIYFSISKINYEVRLGDIVSCNNIYETSRGPVVDDIQLIKRYFEN